MNGQDMAAAYAREKWLGLTTEPVLVIGGVGDQRGIYRTSGFGPILREWMMGCRELRSGLGRYPTHWQESALDLLASPPSTHFTSRRFHAG